MILSLVAVSWSLSLSLEKEEKPYSGVTLRSYRASNPSTDVYVVLVDLCTDYVHVDATRVTDSAQSTGTFAENAGVQIATNGDFYKTGPLRVYGDAVGRGVPWPSVQTGNDSAYASEWYYQHYGWIAFGPEWVNFTHTGWVKDNAASFGGATAGWAPTTVNPTPPVGTLALVSGFPELVVEGKAMTCSDPEASSCFPDRSDMRDRNPRTAMGLTADMKTLILAVIDGRTSSNAGMYGSEEADLMAQLGAWEAFNLDGGGSSQLWVGGKYKNDYDGNNWGSGLRDVANHWGVYAGSGDGRPAHPGHCLTAPACQEIPPEGAVIDDSSACFELFGPSEYWRSEASGEGGHSYWTNAWGSNYTDNWAMWKLYFAEAGDYKVEAYADGAYAVYNKTHYAVGAGGVRDGMFIDQSAANGWVELGTYHFDAGSGQFVEVDDAAYGAVSSNQHITADAIRLTRVGDYCGDGNCTEGCACPSDCPVVQEIPGNGQDDDCDGTVDETTEDTNPPDSQPDESQPVDSALLESGPPGLPGDVVPVAGPECGCSATPGGGWLGAIGLLLLRRRRSS